MTDSLHDDARLRATEAQMRRALGLQSDGPPQPTPAVPSPTPTMGLHPQRRRFVRDGEVLVQHKEHSATGETGTNQLAAARHDQQGPQRGSAPSVSPGCDVPCHQW